MAQTIEDVNDRTLLQQFHSLYKKQDTIETNVENLDTKIEQEKSDRKAADQGLQKLVYQEATEIGKETASLRNDVNTNTAKIEYNATQITALQTGKQDKLTAGTNITIDENNVISASGASGGNKYYRHSILIKLTSSLPSRWAQFTLMSTNNNTLTGDILFNLKLGDIDGEVSNYPTTTQNVTYKNYKWFSFTSPSVLQLMGDEIILDVTKSRFNISLASNAEMIFSITDTITEL